MTLFSENSNQFAPLAAKMRPSNLNEYVGQQHILAPNKALRIALEAGAVHSMILWGAPGTGKTTLAKIIANITGSHFQTISAVLAGVKEIRAAIESAKIKQQQGIKSILFIDEVHRFNKSQQDAFLPFVEDGTIIFIGATTENPSFELNNALLSRTRVYVLKNLDLHDLQTLITRALTSPNGLLQRNLTIEHNALQILLQFADGDGRRALNLLENAADLVADNAVITSDVINSLLTSNNRRFDKGGEAFYDQISALHKSIRGSNPHAALYWLARMLDGGCDPLYTARRLVRMASEDIGNSDPRALTLALNAWDVQQRLGSPEGELAQAQAAVYLACAPKSNAVYMAYKKALDDVKEFGSCDVPLHLRNAPTKLMTNLGYGAKYRYAHDEPEAYAAGEHYFPTNMPMREYYQPSERGLELKISAKLKHLKQLDAKYLANKK